MECERCGGLRTRAQAEKVFPDDPRMAHARQIGDLRRPYGPRTSRRRRQNMGRLRAARLLRASTERRARLCAMPEHFAAHHVRRAAARGRGWARASRTSPSFSVPAMETVLILGILHKGELVERPVDWRQSGAHYTVRLRSSGRRAACIFGVVGVFWKTWSTLTFVRGSISQTLFGALPDFEIFKRVFSLAEIIRPQR